MLGNKRRSFFLFVITVRNSPCNFKRNVDRSAEKREQKHDLFKRHGASPLPALGQNRGCERSKEKSPCPARLGAGKASCNNDDRCLRQKQGGIVGAAASEARVPFMVRCECWEPQPVLRFGTQRLRAADAAITEYHSKLQKTIKNSKKRRSVPCNRL